MSPALLRVAPRRAVGLLALLSALTTTAVVAPGPAASPAEAATVTGNAALPFDMPSTSVLRGTSRKAFAHYVPSLPVSLDNQDPASDYYARNYLTPLGEGGKHKAYGGFLRDRPLTRAPRSGDWRLADMESEVRSARAAGLDGFTLVLYTVPDAGTNRQWQNAVLLMQAARNVDPGFKIVLQPDFSSASGLKAKSAGTMAKYMAQLAAYSSAYRLGDGRTVISPFTAEGKSKDWWISFLSIMKNTYKRPVAFVPLFQNEQVHRSAYDSISYGMSNWGSRNPAWNNPDVTYPTGPKGRIAAVKALGQKWMQPISTQDSRPRSGIFDEAQNTQNLRNTWRLAIEGKADLVHYATWGDYPEGSVMAPTVKHGYALLDISAYYLSKWKTGVAPTIVRDTVYLSHRKHKVSARPTFPQTKLMSLRGGSPARDTVEALTFLKAPASVVVKVGSITHTCSQSAGVDTCTVPLASGTVSAAVKRSGVTVTSVTSPYKVTSAPYVQDLEYVAVSSRRQGTSTTTASTTTATTTAATTTAPTATASTVALTPTADTYANEAAKSTNYGSVTTLAARSAPGLRTFLRFSLPAAPAGKTLTKAVLRTRTSGTTGAGSAGTQRVAKAGNTWSESTLTWNAKPAVGTGTLGTIGSTSGTNITRTTTLDAAALRADLGKQVTLAVVGNGTDSTWLWSSEHANTGYRPQLTLTFS